MERPFICVPFDDPKSLRRYPLVNLVSEACCADTVGSSMTTSLDGARPIVIRSPINSCVMTSTPSQSRIRRAIWSPIFKLSVYLTTVGIFYNLCQYSILLSDLCMDASDFESKIADRQR